ncbi:MAG: hypothetical protein VW715_14895 [Rhodospirillales bacterium]
MTQQNRPPEPQGEDWQTWGRRLMTYLSQTRIPLVQQTGNEPATDDGLLMWDRSNGWPTVSYNNEWRQIVMRGGHATFIRDSDVTAAAADTAYSITYDAPTGNSRIDRDATNNERIVFDEAGEYLISFTAQIASSSASTVNFYFWPAVNGVNQTGSTMVNALHQNDATLVVSRSAIFDLSANDYLEVKWAVDSTNGKLDATAATAFAPSSPSTTLVITRIHE